MASLWNKTLFYLGLVDEDVQDAEPIDSRAGSVHQMDAPLPPEPAYQPPPRTSVPYASATAAVRPPGTLAGRRVEPPSATRRSMSMDANHAEAGLIVHPTVSEAPPEPSVARRMEPDTHIIVARNFSDAQALADAIRAGRAVVLDLRSTEPEMVRRIVDFASGLTYALDGKMSKTSQGVILVTPAGLVLDVPEQERLARLGLFGVGQ